MSRKQPEPGTIDVVGAAENNLQSLDVSLPLGRLVAVTGPSGSGKTSLVHGIIGRVARRRWDRMLGHGAAMSPAYGPAVKELRGIPACVELKQEPLRGSTRSSIATYTGIAAALASVFAHDGEQRSVGGEALLEPREIDLVAWARRHHSPRESELFELTCRDEVVRATALPNAANGQFLFRESANQWQAFSRAQLVQKLPARGWLAVRHEPKRARARLTAGSFVLRVGDVVVDPVFHRVSLNDPRPYWKPTPRLFSPFASAFGADVCADCRGNGNIESVRESAIVADARLPLLDGGLTFPMKEGRFLYLGVLDRIIRGFLRSNDLRTKTKSSWRDLREDHRRALLHGTESPIPEAKGDSDAMNKGKPFGGLIHLVTAKAASAGAGASLFAGMRERRNCPACAGSGLGASAREVSFHGRQYHELLTQSVGDVLRWVSSLPRHAARALERVASRLEWLSRLSLGYLALGRHTSTLSGGEGQRLRLSSVMMGQAQGMALVLDEPCRGLHPSDTLGIIDVLRQMVDAGNSLIVVEHNETLIRAADDIVALGPGGGSRGGRIVTISDASQAAPVKSREQRERRKKKRARGVLEVVGLSINNVKNARLSLPTGALTVVVGPAGAGKSSAILKGLLPAVHANLQGTKLPIYRDIRVPPDITFAEGVDQRLIARSSRSTVGTLLALMDALREHFGRSDEARSSGLQPSDFSFNNSGGACPGCSGVGRLLTSDEEPTDELCHLCRGYRLKSEALAIRSAGKAMSDLLSLSVEDLVALDHPAFGLEAQKTLSSLLALGLGHLQLARSLDTLSGGERKRLGIARFQLHRLRDRQRGLVVLDEPSSGLHTSDIARLYDVISAMARDDGHTVVVIEHQATAIAHADHIIDVGPAAGSEGGRILFSGDRFDFQKSDAPSAKAFEQEPGMRRHWTATSESVQVTGDSAPAGGDGIALLSEGSDLDGVWEHAARIRPVVKVAARAANQDARVWELLDLAPTILRFADREGSSGRVTAAASDDELRARLRSDACAFSPVARHLRMQGPALIDLKPAVIALLSLGYTEAVLDGKKHPLKELPKFVKDRLGLRSCLVVHPRDATHLIETTIRWSAGVISLLGRSPAVENILSLRHIADDGKIGAAFGDPHVADSRSPVGRCGSCAGSGLVRTYDLSLVVRKMSASIADKAFLAPELAAAFRGALTREILPAARVFTEQGVVDLLTPPSRLERGDRFAFEYGIERRLLKASAKRTDREADWHRWRGLHDYVYQSWSRIPDDLRARLRASYREVTCPACTGTGLTWESERVFIGRRSVRDWWAGGKVKELAAALPDYRALKLAVASGLGDLRLGARLSELDAQSTAIQLVSAVVGPLRGVELTVPDVSDFDGLRRSLRRESMQLSSTEMAPDVP